MQNPTPSGLGPDMRAQSVADIAVNRPGATAVFRRFKIDYCGGGAASLASAAADCGAAADAVIAALEALAGDNQPPPQATGALIDYLLGRYHDVHRRQFPEAIRLARRVEVVHRGHADCPVGLSQHLAFMFDDLEVHHQKEELGVFPMMRNGDPHAAAPIPCMEADHEDVVEQLKGLARLTHEFTPPEGACTTWRALYALCREIDIDLRDHIRLENKVLFRRFG